MSRETTQGSGCTNGRVAQPEYLSGLQQALVSELLATRSETAASSASRQAPPADSTSTTAGATTADSTAADLPAAESAAADSAAADLPAAESAAADSATAGPHPQSIANGYLAAEIVPGGTLSPEAALEVYRNGYYVRLTEQLGETFEAVWCVLGDHGFFDVCRRFIATTRSRSYNLSDYGEGFAGFLAESGEGREFPFLADLARFEWEFKELFHRREHRHVDAEAFQSHPDPTAARLELGDACMLFASDYAVHSLWKVRKTQTTQAPLDWERAERVLAYKLDGNVYMHDLDPAAFRILELIGEGSSIDEALELAGADHRDLDEAAVSVLFATVVSSGIVSSIGQPRS